MENIRIEHREMQNSQGSYNLDILSTGTGYGAIVVPIARFRGLSYVGLVKQWREALQQEVVELPRGSTKDLSDAEAAREASEEMGYSTDRLRFIGTLSPDTGLLTNKVGVWIAAYPSSIIHETFNNPDENNIHAEWVNAPQAAARLLNQPVVCSMSLAAFFMVQSKGMMVAAD